MIDRVTETAASDEDGRTIEQTEKFTRAKHDDLWPAIKASPFGREIIREVVRRWERANYPAKVDMETIGNIARDERVSRATRDKASKRAVVIWWNLVRDAGARSNANTFATRLKATIISDFWERATRKGKLANRMGGAS
jgi:hypothetical protein